MPKKKGQPGNLERRGTSYRVTLCVDGKLHRFTVPTTDRRVAQASARQRLAELHRERDRRLAGLPDVVRMSGLLDEYKRTELPTLAPGTQRSYGDSLKPIRQYFVDEAGDPAVDKVRGKQVNDYLNWRRTRRLIGRRKTDGGVLHNRTLNKDRAVLRRVFTIAEQREWVASNPVRLTEARNADAREAVIPTDSEYDRLLTACAGYPALAMYVLLLGETGMRCDSEALRLQWQDVDFATGFIKVVSGRDGHRTKTGKSRQIPMTRRLVAALREYFAGYRFAAQSPYLFHHSKTKRNHRAGGRIGTLRRAFKNAAARVKLPTNFVQHDLRHRRVTTWLAEGKSPVLVMKAMGHSRLETTMHYYKYLPEHLRALVEPTALPATQAVAM
jgi:integrase